MRYPILVGLLLAAFALPAEAAKVLRQNADGTTSWYNTVDGSSPPAGEHHFVVTITDIATASTHFVVIPFDGRLKAVYGVTHGQIGTATAQIDFVVGAATGVGGSADMAFTAVTPAIAEAATGNYELQLPLAYAATGRVSSVTFPHNSNTSLDISAGEYIAIRHDGRATVLSTDGEADDVTLTIIVH
jgi:hypothetical protein